jgi:hypothetical protein
MRAIYNGVKEKANLVGIDGTLLFAAVADDIEKKVRRLHMRGSEEDGAE